MTPEQEAIEDLENQIAVLQRQLDDEIAVSRNRHVTLTKYREQVNILLPALEAASEQAAKTAKDIEDALRQLRQL